MLHPSSQTLQFTLFLPSYSILEMLSDKTQIKRVSVDYFEDTKINFMPANKGLGLWLGLGLRLGLGLGFGLGLGLGLGL